MALTRADRFRLEEAIVDQMNAAHLDWDYQHRNLLLSEFKLETAAGDSWNDRPFEDAISDISDTDLLEMQHIVTGVKPQDVADAIEAAEPGNWKTGYVRLFMSHSAVHREFVGQVSDELAVVGIDGFVAHNTMEKGKPWQTQIEQALRTMDASSRSCTPSSTPAPGASKRQAGLSAGVCRSSRSAWVQTHRGSWVQISGRLR
jgi:uncharacterized protein (DUF4415 family)